MPIWTDPRSNDHVRGAEPERPALPPLRILTPIHSLDPGGVERVAIRLNEAWAGIGLDCVVALGRRSRFDRPANGGLRYRIAPAPPLSPAPFETIWMIWWLVRTIRAERPDVLYCPGNTYAVVVAVVRLLLGRACPPIVAKISNDLSRADQPRVFRALYHAWCRLQGRLIDRFVVPAESLRADVMHLMRAEHHRVWTVFNPVLKLADLRRLAEPGEAQSLPGRRFVAAGRLVRQKNFAFLLDCFAAGSHPDDRLVILGEGPERAALRRRIERLGLSGRAMLAGHQDDLTAWLRNSDILLLSSDYEGVPGIVIEALAAGLAVVATDCSPAMRDLLDDGRFGALVPVRDQNAFALSLATAAPAEDRDARSRHAACFSVEAAALSMAELLGQLVAGCKNSDISDAVEAGVRRRGGD